MMGGWGEFAAESALFLISHAVPSWPGLKTGLIARIRRSGYLVLYNAVSVVLLAWLIVAAGRAPYLALWPQLPWHRWAINIVMPFAVLLGAFGIGTANPLSFGGRRSGFDAEHPGVVGFVRHPLLWALLLWAAAHLLANGDLAHVILFGGFAAMAIIGMVAIDARNRRRLGPAEWERLSHRTSSVPGMALMRGRWRPKDGPTPWRVILALAIWPLLLWMHPVVIGVSPLP